MLVSCVYFFSSQNFEIRFLGSYQHFINTTLIIIMLIYNTMHFLLTDVDIIDMDNFPAE